MSDKLLKINEIEFTNKVKCEDTEVINQLEAIEIVQRLINQFDLEEYIKVKASFGEIQTKMTKYQAIRLIKFLVVIFDLEVEK